MTKFGELLRILRIKNHEVMGDVAKLLGVSTPFLSAVENGKKNVPTTWKDVLIDHYNLGEEEIVELSNAIEESKVSVKINTSNAGVSQRLAAMQFARSFDDMDEETAKRILELLKNN